MPGRRFPGIVIQGDSLSVLVGDAQDLVRVLTDANLPAVDDAQELCSRLTELLGHYAETLTENGIPLPYEPSATKITDQDLHLSGWVYNQDGRRFLELASSFVGYDFDDDDWRAITTQLEREPERAASYPLSGSYDLMVDIRLEDDGRHLSLAFSGEPNRYLQIQIETLFAALPHPADSSR